MATSNLAEESRGAGESPSATAGEMQLRQQQLRIIERTSWPGVICCSVGGAGLVWLAGQEQYSSMRAPLLGVVVCLEAMAAIWATAIRCCRRDDLPGAFTRQLVANLIGTVLFFVFVDRGAILALLTASVGLSAGAMVLEDRLQDRVALLTIAVTLGSAAASEVGIVEPIVLPSYILYCAVAVGIIFSFRTPISAFRIYNQNLRASRAEALRNGSLASEACDRANAHARGLKEVDDELREFTYVVSHDLRAPLINIDGFSAVLGESLEDFDMLVRESDSATAVSAAWAETHSSVVEALHFIASGVAKMGALIDGLLVLSRIDNHPLEASRVALPELVEEVVQSMQHQIRERGIAVEIGSLPEIVCERLRISQVFGNLIDNAIKYMPDRAPREISIQCETGDDFFTFSVTDTGNGIPRESRQKIFRPFQRLVAGDAAVGDGLGLAAVKKIVDRHGGQIWVEDGPEGRGASFRVRWPRRPPLTSDAATRAAA